MVGQKLLAEVKDDFYDLVHSLNSLKFWQSVLVTWVGLIFYSIGINALLVPHKFIAGGATGIALLIYYVLHSPSVGVIYWLLNIPILLLGWRFMSLKYVALALIGVFLSGLTLTVTRDLHIPANDPLMAAVLAGVLTGGGTGLYLRYGGSSGGMDIVAAVLRRKYGIPMGTTFISVNAINFILGGLLNHSLELAFYTAVAMAVHSRMVERMQIGFSGRKSALIVSSRPDEIADQIMRRLNRGVTFLHGSGGKSQQETRVVYTVVNMIELARLKEIIFHIDPRAFIAVNDTSEVIGYRFISWADAGFDPQARLRAASRAQARGEREAVLTGAEVGAKAKDDREGSKPPPPPGT